MFINRVSANYQNIQFKGIQHSIDNIGNNVYRFNYPFDYDNENCEILLFKLKQLPNYEYELIKTPLAKITLDATGTDVDVKSLIGLNDTEPFAYKYIRRDKNSGEIIAEGADSGQNFRVENNKVVFYTHAKSLDDKNKPNDYTFVSRKGTLPRVYGAGYSTFPDSQRVGIYAKSFNDDNTGDIFLDKNLQAELEKTQRHFSSKTGGNLAGLEYNLDYLSNIGCKVQVANPIAGGDNRSGHHYWNKNNMQISDDMGNTEQFNSYIRKLFQKGMTYLYDATLTSEGLEGIHFQYALRWADKNPQTYYWFKMQGIKNQPIGLGVFPKNKQTLSHRVINPPTIYNEKTHKIEKNHNYNSKKETLFQIYDSSQVTKEQLSKLDKPIETYQKLKSGDFLKINSHNDTLINYVFEVNPQEYSDRLESYIKNNKKNVAINSPEGTMYIAQFSNFKLYKKSEGGLVAWDANTDMVKLNYHTSGYDEKLEQYILNPLQKSRIKELRKRGAFEVQDLAHQVVKYWASKVKNSQILYSAQVLKNAESSTQIEDFISKGLLPSEAFLNEDEINNIKRGFYILAQKGEYDKDNTTLKALMALPLDTLEFAENTVGVLSTSYFSNRAIDEDTLGLSRFELLQKDNPHLVEEYKSVYLKVNSMFANEIKGFADEIINKVNASSQEKLLDEHGNYTEFGEYVIELIGADITKYAFLKSLTGDKLKTKILPNGEITYDYRHIKEMTSLKSLGIDEATPEEEAMALFRLIKKGLSKLNSTDAEFLSKSIFSRISGLSTNSFRIAEAMVNKAGKDLAWRLDAAKDTEDQDAIRSQDATFDQIFTNLTNFWGKLVQTIKTETPHAYIMAELTDVADVMRDSLGERTSCYDNMPNIGLKFKSVPETMIKLFNETGITSEAAYSYFFTDLLKTFGPDLTNGEAIVANPNMSSEEATRIRCNNFYCKTNELINTRSADYVRSLYTFVGNHDKPRILHGLALDMKLFHGSLSLQNKEGVLDYKLNRENRIETLKQLTNADDFDSLPLEAKLNIDNPEYFKTASLYAVATSQLLRNAINDSLNGIATDLELSYIKSALVDLTNGNFKDNGNTTKIPAINIQELASVENALNAIVKLAKIQISDSDIEAIVREANKSQLIEEFYVHNDLSYIQEPLKTNDNTIKKVLDDIKRSNYNKIDLILRGSNEGASSQEKDYEKYSLYTVAVVGLIRKAFINVMGEEADTRARFLDACKEFVKKYDKANIDANKTPLPTFENSALTMAKKAFASEDFKTSLEMLIEQAEYKARKDGKLGENQHFANSDDIILNVWKNATEPAIQKASMMMSFLSALVGIPTIYGGDELGMSGYDEKAKNIYLKNRNPLPWSELEDGIFKDFRTKIQQFMLEGTNIRNRSGVNALNNGTAYSAMTSDKNIPAFIMQDGYGNMTVSIFNATGINVNNRFDYFKSLGITDENKKSFFEENKIDSFNPDNRYVPIQKNVDIDFIELCAGISLPLGLTFLNSDARDKAEYIIKKIDNKFRIVNKNGGKISLNGFTAKNGVMVLKHAKDIGKRLAFKGSYNTQYQIFNDIYSHKEKQVVGTKFSCNVV